MMMTRKKWLFVGMIGILLLAGTILLIREPRTDSSSAVGEPAPVSAEVIRVTLEEWPVLREVTGTVAPRLKATLASRASGWVREVTVTEGSRVRSGKALVLMDDRDLAARLNAAEAQLENAARRLERIRTLFQEGSATEQARDDAEQAFRVASAESAAAKSALAYARIEAPFDGVITRRWIEPGDLVSPGRPLLDLEDDRHLRLEAMVPEREIQSLETGQTIGVRIDALSEVEITGTVSQIVPSADPATHSFLVKVDLPAVEGLRSGLFGRLRFQTGTRNSLTVPLEAVRQSEGLARVYVPGADGILKSRLVKLGRMLDGRAEVLSGLEPGESIVKDAALAREGARVSPEPAHE